MYDIKKAKYQLLIKNLRTGNFTYNQADSTLWGIRHENGFYTLIQLNQPYTDWEAIHQLVLFEMSDVMNKNFSYKVPIDFEDSTPGK